MKIRFKSKDTKDQGHNGTPDDPQKILLGASCVFQV
jgi:hypothetical protein